MCDGKIKSSGDTKKVIQRYLTENNYFETPLTAEQILEFRPEAMIKLQEFLDINATEATKLLWDTYNPSMLWTPFAAVGILSAIGIFFYARWVKDVEKGV